MVELEIMSFWMIIVLIIQLLSNGVFLLKSEVRLLKTDRKTLPFCLRIYSFSSEDICGLKISNSNISIMTFLFLIWMIWFGFKYLKLKDLNQQLDMLILQLSSTNICMCLEVLSTQLKYNLLMMFGDLKLLPNQNLNGNK